MLSGALFAEADPATGITNYLFTQGVLGVALVAAIVVIIYLQRKLDRKDEKIDTLQNARLDDNKVHTADYREMAKDNAEVLSGNSQNMRILSEKIEIAKRGRN